MAGDVVIRAEGLGKKYLIGHQTEARATTLREALGRSARGLARSAGAMMKGRQLVAGDAVEEFWALKDVSFEVKRGEVVGVIGRNGAGKSTLLKILSRITEPTEGRVEIKGRVASLLEVGTGFHPELTGRENIFLNGAILGMTRAEIRRKFDEIVDFAGIEKFLDTPVKRYSSGMYVRLAFAVAAHLEPEILIVDEVLAVGDAEFQKKCLGKMQDVAGHGRTVLFVSHNMAAVERLCSIAVMLEEGRLIERGAIDRVMSRYLARSSRESHYLDLSAVRSRSGKGALRFKELAIWGDRRSESPKTGGPLNLELTFFGAIQKPKPARIGVAISSITGSPLILCSTEMTLSEPPLLAPGGRYVCHIPVLPLTAGSYVLTLFVEQAGLIEDWLADVGQLEVQDSDFFGFGKNSPAGHEGRHVLVAHHWSFPEPVNGKS